MFLKFLPANNAWAFVFGTALVRMGNAQMFFNNRDDAVKEAAGCGLAVDAKGVVSVINQGEEK
jgi:hypothetical protein